MSAGPRNKAANFEYKALGRKTKTASGKPFDVCAGAAYRANEKITSYADPDNPQVFDYTDKGDNFHSILIIPEGASCSKEELWNKVDKKEKRKDSLLVNDINMALPKELSVEDMVACGNEFGQLIHSRYENVPVQLDGHIPNAKSKKDKKKFQEAFKDYLDNRTPENKSKIDAIPNNHNYHFHVRFPRRGSHTDENGELQLNRKLIGGMRYHPRQRKVVLRDDILGNSATSSNEIKFLRKSWEEIVNKKLKERGLDTRIDLSSNEDYEKKTGYKHPDGHRTKKDGPAKTHMRKKYYQERATAKANGLPAPEMPAFIREEELARENAKLLKGAQMEHEMILNEQARRRREKEQAQKAADNAAKTARKKAVAATAIAGGIAASNIKKAQATDGRKADAAIRSENIRLKQKLNSKDSSEFEESETKKLLRNKQEDDLAIAKENQKFDEKEAQADAEFSEKEAKALAEWKRKNGGDAIE